MKQLDDYMGQLTEKMKKWGILDNTVIIVTSDHGEELFEHGFIGHASTSLNAKLYDEIIHIPLIIWWPKKLKHRVVDELVQQIDIMPTILDMLGLLPSEGLQGYSLLPSIQGQKNLRIIYDLFFVRRFWGVSEHKRDGRDQAPMCQDERVEAHLYQYARQVCEQWRIRRW